MNVFEEIGVRKVINASGRMTALGVSTVSEEVAIKTKQGSQNYVVIDELIDRAGEIVSTYTNAEDSCVTCSASAGIALSIAGLITKGKISLVHNLPLTEGLKNEVIIQKGHAVDYGAPVTSMIRLVGGVPIEVGYSNTTMIEHIEEAINEKTVALMYVKSHHCVQKSMVSLDDMIKIGRKYNIPVVVDAAAEEDLKLYIEKGSDLVIYSGAKALEAPTSGFITGKKEYISYAKKQYKGIGRAMKIGKENIIGLLAALDRYVNIDKDKEIARQKSDVDFLVEEMNKIDGLKADVSIDEAGRLIYRAEVKVDENVVGMNAKELARKLADGNPSIHGRNHRLNLGYLNFDPRPLIAGDREVIVQTIKKLVEEK